MGLRSFFFFSSLRLRFVFEMKGKGGKEAVRKGERERERGREISILLCCLFPKRPQRLQPGQPGVRSQQLIAGLPLGCTANPAALASSCTQSGAAGNPNWAVLQFAFC